MMAGNTPLHLAMESGHGAAAVALIEAGADRERVSPRGRAGVRLMGQINADGEVPEEIGGVGGNEQKNVRAFVVSKVGPRRE